MSFSLGEFLNARGIGERNSRNMHSDAKGNRATWILCYNFSLHFLSLLKVLHAANVMDLYIYTLHNTIFTLFAE